MAILVLLYDLCLTPVAIAWDFPMQGWLLHLGLAFRASFGARCRGIAPLRSPHSGP